MAGEGLDAFDQLVLTVRLQNVSASASLEGLRDDMVLLMRGEEQDLGCRQRLFYPAGYFDTIEVRQVQIDCHELWMQLQSKSDGLRASLCIATYNPAWVPRQQDPESPAEDVVIVHHKYSHRATKTCIESSPARELYLAFDEVRLSAKF